jgi:hypothetical protein
MSTSDDAADTRRLKPEAGFVPPSPEAIAVMVAPKLSLWGKIKYYVYAAVAGMGAVLIGILLWKSSDRGPSNLPDSIAVQKKRQHIENLRAKREVAISAVDARDAEVVAIDREIIESKKKILSIQESAEGLSDAEAETAFDRLGY